MWRLRVGVWELLPRVVTHLPVVSSPLPAGQEELEFAIMRIEALKLARQIALASRSRQDAKVPVCCRGAVVPGMLCVPPPHAQSCFANQRSGRHSRCPTGLISKAESVALP